MPSKMKSPQDLEKLQQTLSKKLDAGKPRISICNGTACRPYGSNPVAEAFKAEIEKRDLGNQLEFKVTGCHGFCERGPVAIVEPGNLFYQKIKVEDVPEIVEKTLKGETVSRLLFKAAETGKEVAGQNEVPFYRNQTRIVLGNNVRIDPTSIEDYIAIGGYSALSKALHTMQPDQIIDVIKQSGLRGRGGGGFPTGLKWETCRKAHGDIKYVIVNADEGDPGAYANEGLLSGNPHSVLEGLIIGAFAIGAHQGYVYVRNEYPLALKNINIAMQQAEKLGLLGKDILGSGFDFSVRINRGGGAFVCGESTALMASLEGKTGEPRAKYIHTVEKGLWDRPSDLNNVETWANIPLIISKGPEWFNSIGSKGNTGTKIFSLTGKVNNTGLVEVPMGIKLRDIIFDIGGGIRGNKKFKAVQTGGPSGGCLPEKLLDLAVDFDELTKAGSMMGSGGMIVMDEDNCMVDVARYFLTFLEEESCGKCVPCREGVKRMKQILTDITEGKGRESDLDLLKELSAHLKDSALCALGSSAPNPVLTTIKYFLDEYEAHIKQKKCPAGVCKSLIKFSIIDEKCPGCGMCVKICPAHAITDMGKKKPVILDQSKCIKCRTCYDVCRMGAVKIE
ncbi:MAG: NADH-ubiquinone oxidoreductase-F iron-sulfur binding region domain-containing protein [Dehalococcoidia bacterium]|nr:NADH-ubiquinone oxidoreductase-F iron-sulfur binding region domain-containing protein [Dehalococcoidia bacterium]MDD5495103.1 NADH-ubiquinone oxidoreductase-F iron-sulfur binding region domain-containing protein [Dehalococcoidia bacterium]